MENKKGKNALFVDFDKKEKFKVFLFAIYHILPEPERWDRRCTGSGTGRHAPLTQHDECPDFSDFDMSFSDFDINFGKISSEMSLKST